MQKKYLPILFIFTLLLALGGPIDLDALIAYIQGLSQPVSAQVEGRIIRLN